LDRIRSPKNWPDPANTAWDRGGVPGRFVREPCFRGWSICRPYSPSLQIKRNYVFFAFLPTCVCFGAKLFLLSFIIIILFFMLLFTKKIKTNLFDPDERKNCIIVVIDRSFW
jgi:hypothetical protein